MVFYYKMWDLVKEKGISHNELSILAGVSKATLTKMRKDQYVSLESLDKIRGVLGCKFEDMISSEPPSKNSVSNIKTTTDSMQHFSKALSTYIQQTGITVSQISKITGVSVNTVKSIIDGNNSSAYTVLKMMKLGQGFCELLDNNTVETSINDISLRKNNDDFRELQIKKDIEKKKAGLYR